MSIMIEKRNGKLEPLNAEKYHKHLEHAVRGIDGVSISQLEMDASMQIVNGTKSIDIQKALIKTAGDGVYDNYKLDKVAARLLNQDLRKEVYGQYEPKPFLDMLIKNLEDNVYDKDYLLDNYTLEEISEISSVIDYDKDDEFTYGGLKKNCSSYLIKKYDKIRETPQELYLALNLYVFAKYKDKYSAEFRKRWVKLGYEILSSHYVSLPTPIIKQLRTTFRRFISCVLIPFGDTKNTIANAFRTILVVVAGGAGLGLGVSDIRGLDAYIDDGRMKHEGIFPILKAAEKTTKAFTQPDRDGSSTEYFPWFHIEVERLMVLGNAKGTDDVRVRDMDHAIMFEKLFFERYAMNKDVTLFYMNDVNNIVSYMGDYDKFKEMYEEAEARVPDDRKVVVPAKLIFHTFIDERVLTSREYTAFMDNIQEHSSYDVPIKESNLCTEITQPNYPIYDTTNIKRNIVFETESDREMYYKIRKEAYYHQDSDSVKKYQELLRPYYKFYTNDLEAEVDETKPYDYFDISGMVNLSEVGVCIIAGINLGMVPEDKIPLVSEYLVRLEDELIDYMEYDLPEIEKAAKMRRGIGIGFSDIFHLLAKNNVKYNTLEGRQLVHDRVELAAYHMIKTSIQLAKDFGPCMLYTDTKYAKGLLPIDTYAKTVDELVKHNNLNLDWDTIREDLSKYGMRHSTLMANAPFGSSSIPSNATPGIEPPRGLITKKDGLPKIVPEYELYKDNYTLVWSDEFNNLDYFKFIAVVQKHMDQTISVNQYHNLNLYPDKKIPQSLMIEEILLHRYYGGQTLYYLNITSTKDGEDVHDVSGDVDELDNDINEDIVIEDSYDACGSGGCSI